MKKIIFIIIIFLFIGCENKLPSEDRIIKAPYENELRYGLSNSSLGVFASQYEMGDYDDSIISLSYESLVVLNPSNEYEGVLAKYWEITDDFRSIIFHLRKDVKWHDGKTFTANDVAFSIYYLANPDYTGKMYKVVAPIKGVKDFRNNQILKIDGVEIIDSYTIKISTSTVYAPLIEYISNLKIFPKHIWENINDTEALSNKGLLLETIGTGPYFLESMVIGKSITMKRNSDYWGGKVNIEFITFEVISNKSAKIKMINNKLDFTQIITMDKNEFKLYKNAGLSIQKVNYNSFQSIVINTENFFLKDVFIRQAIARAIDRKLLVDTLIFGQGVVANTVYRKEHFAYPGDFKLDDYTYNPKQAVKDIIRMANLKYQNRVLYKDNKPIELMLIYSCGNKARELSAPIIQENLSNIGIKVNIEKIEYSELIKRMNSGDYDMGLIDSGFNLDPDVSRFFSTDTINNGNYSRFSNKELDFLLEEGVEYLDKVKRSEIYKKIAVLLNDQLPMIFLYHWSESCVLSNRLKGVICNPYNYFYNIQNWYLEG